MMHPTGHNQDIQRHVILNAVRGLDAKSTASADELVVGCFSNQANIETLIIGRESRCGRKHLKRTGKVQHFDLIVDINANGLHDDDDDNDDGSIFCCLGVVQERKVAL